MVCMRKLCDGLQFNANLRHGTSHKLVEDYRSKVAIPMDFGTMKQQLHT